MAMSSSPKSSPAIGFSSTFFPALRLLQPLPLYCEECSLHRLELRQLCDQPPALGLRHCCSCHRRLLGSPETVPLHLWSSARGCRWLCPLPRPLQLLPQPARLPRELQQVFQVQESWCQGRSTQSASGF